MFASFAVSFDDPCDLTGAGLSLSMRLRYAEGNQLRLELESSAALTSCECRINEPEMRRLTHSMLPGALKPSSVVSIASPKTTNSMYLSQEPLQLCVSRPSSSSEPPERTSISPSTTVPKPSHEPELSSVSKLAAVSSANELSKCFQSVANSRVSLPDANTQQKQQVAPLLSSNSSDGSDSHTNDSDSTSDSTNSSKEQSRSRSASLPLTDRQRNVQPQQNNASSKQESSGSDTSDSDDSDNSNIGSSVSALLQRAAIPHSGTKSLDVKQGIDLKKQRERLSQVSSLPLEALTSADLMNAAVSMAKKNT